MSQIPKSIMVVFSCIQKQKMYNLEMEPDTLISEISNCLYDCLQCLPNEKCVLYFKNQELSIDQTLQYYGIVKGNQIEIKIVNTEPQQQQLFTGDQKHQYTFIIPEKKITFTPPKINPLDKGKVAYDLVRDQYNYSIQLWDVQIYFGGKLLKPEMSFYEYKIVDGTAFTVNVKSHGGQVKCIQ